MDGDVLGGWRVMGWGMYVHVDGDGMGDVDGMADVVYGWDGGVGWDMGGDVMGRGCWSGVIGMWMWRVCDVDVDG